MQRFRVGYYGDPQLSRQKQIVSPQKQICYGKSKLEMAKANSLRQKQIRNGKSKFVTANWKWQQPVGKSRKQICHGKSKLYTEEVLKSWRTPKIVQDKSKTRSAKSAGKVFWSQKQKAYDKSKLVTSLQLITSQKHTSSSQKQITFASLKSNNSYLDSLSIHSEGLGAK